MEEQKYCAPIYDGSYTKGHFRVLSIFCEMIKPDACRDFRGRYYWPDADGGVPFDNGVQPNVSVIKHRNEQTNHWARRMCSYDHELRNNAESVASSAEGLASIHEEENGRSL